MALPQSFERRTIDGRDWITYPLGVGPGRDLRDYFVPLNPDAYLFIGFDFVDNSRGQKTTWRRDAQAVADEIIASMELRKLQ
jgi:hypothetical protein